MAEQITIKELFDCRVSYLQPLLNKHTYPWQVLPELKGYIRQLINEGLEGFTEIAPGVLVGQNVKIAATATIEGPAIIEELSSTIVVPPGHTACADSYLNLMISYE